MDMPAHLLYTPDHLWVRIDGNRAMIGITEYAQEELGIVVFAELPPLGEKVRTGLYMSMVESAKQDMDIIARYPVRLYWSIRLWRPIQCILTPLPTNMDGYW